MKGVEGILIPTENEEFACRILFQEFQERLGLFREAACLNLNPWNALCADSTQLAGVERGAAERAGHRPRHPRKNTIGAKGL